ncbi:MAG: hypothetical protein Q9224_006647 [Gallowayella concinna]
MSSIHHAHLRTSPPLSRKPGVKAARLASLGASKSLLKSNGKSTGKAKAGKDKAKEKAGEVLDDDDPEDDDMATSFLQFCVTCDQQILVPNNSLLYCSERCKRMDAQHVSDYSSYVPMTTPIISGDGELDPPGSKEPLVPRAIPTPRPTPSARIPPKAHEGKSDLDPTEWKPKLVHRPSSDASKYLSQFHSTPPAYGSPRRASPHRPAAVSSQTMSSIPMNAPSLSATPSASSTSSSSDSIAGTPSDFDNHLWMQHRPNHVHSKSVNLVIPRMIPTAYSVPAKPVTHGGGGSRFSVKVKDIASTTAVSDHMGMASDLSYEKWNLAVGCHSAGVGSLTTLLSGAANFDPKSRM